MSDWRLAWTLARRELRGRFRGLRLLIVCLFLGVGALAAIGSLSSAIGEELAARGRSILGGDIELSVSQRAATANERARMARIGQVSETVRMQATAISRGRSQPVELKGVDDRYPLIGRVRLADGRLVGGPSGDAVYIGPALAERLGIGIGDPVQFGTAMLRVAGIIADEPDRLSEGFTLGPVAIVSMAAIERTGLVQPGSLFERKFRVAMATSADPAAAAESFTQAFPIGGWETRTRDRAAPGAARFVERMGQFLVLVGLAALVIAGIGVGNGVSSYLAARRGGIATLKVLGATSATIARVYLLQLAAAAAIGIGAGLIAGMVAVPVIVALAGDVLPVSPGFSIEPLPLALAALYGALIALAFTVEPLAEAGAVPAAGLLRGVHDRRRAPWRRTLPLQLIAGGVILGIAIGSADQRGLTAGFLAAVAGVLLLLGAIGWLVRRGAKAMPRPRSPLWRLAIGGLHRPGARTGALVVALGLGLTLFVLLAAIRTSLDANIAGSVPARAPALFALDLPRDREAEFRQAVQAVAPGAEIATVPVLRGRVTGYRDIEVADLETLPEGAWAVRGERNLTYAATPPAGSEVIAGRWWRADDRTSRLVSVDEQLATALGLSVGDPIRFTLLGIEREATVASIRRIKWDSFGFNFILVFSPGAIADAPHNLAATIDMPAAAAERVIAAVQPRFPSTTVVAVGGILGQVQAILGQMSTAIAAAASIAVLAGIAVLIGAIAATREARTYDGVILKTLGATRGQVLGVQAIEYALLSLVLAGVALLLGGAGAWWVMTQLFGFEWRPDWAVVLLTLAAGAGITMAAGLIGAVPILSARPARALREL